MLRSLALPQRLRVAQCVRGVGFVAAAVLGAAGCRGSSHSEDSVRETTQVAEHAKSPPEGSVGPRFVAGPASGALSDGVAQARSAASAEGRLVVVYVGATWCEPCQRFHHAVEQGELATVAPLARVTFVEFDLDRDGDRLVRAGYQSKYIPLFALPGPDGRGTGKQVEGGIKGDGAVAYMVPRLTALLAL